MTNIIQEKEDTKFCGHVSNKGTIQIQVIEIQYLDTNTKH